VRCQLNGSVTIWHDLKIVAIDSDANAYGFSDADHVLNLGLSEVDILLAALVRIKVKFAGVVSFVSKLAP
jgi:hypothetical protein